MYTCQTHLKTTPHNSKQEVCLAARFSHFRARDLSATLNSLLRLGLRQPPTGFVGAVRERCYDVMDETNTQVGRYPTMCRHTTLSRIRRRAPFLTQLHTTTTPSNKTGHLPDPQRPRAAAGCFLVLLVLLLVLLILLVVLLLLVVVVLLLLVVVVHRLHIH